MSNEEIDKTSQRTWYLPQHAVFNEQKPNKIRTDVDAAVQHDGMSLNKALLTGPDWLNNLTGILLQIQKS